MDRHVPGHLIPNAPNGQESDYGSSPWIELGEFNSTGGHSFIPPPYLTTQSPFSGTSWLPAAPLTLSKPQPVPIPRLHTTPAPSAPTPRRILTDQDRRRMCLYHEENRSAKQTDIGALFGVERSTVSKVLRQKEKYLSMDDRSQSPIKRSKGKVPDIGKALTNWARKYQSQGSVLTYALIEEKARLFATSCASPDGTQKIVTADWLEEFMQKIDLPASNPRKKSTDTIASDEESMPHLQSSTVTPRSTAVSPISPLGLTPPCLPPSPRQENIKKALGNSPFNFSRDPAEHDHSITLNTPPSLSVGLTSSTLPLVSESPYAATELNSPLENLEERHLIDTCDDSSRNSIKHHESNTDLKSMADSMQPPHVLPCTVNSPLPLQSPTQDEARLALELVINYIQNRTSELGLQSQDYISIGRLREKLDAVRNNQSISGRHR